MLAGKLDRRITIQRKTVVQDASYGTESVTWTTFAARIAAQVQDILPSRAETMHQDLRIASRPARVRIRYLAGITADMRVVVHDAADRTLQIIAGPAELGRRDGIELMCQEYTS
jgi:SPP1 family predicted phage head-tail adaptor